MRSFVKSGDIRALNLIKLLIVLLAASLNLIKSIATIENTALNSITNDKKEKGKPTGLSD